MKILNNLSGWIADLQPRERVVVSIGAALLVVAGLYMALLPAMQKNAELDAASDKSKRRHSVVARAERCGKSP